MIVYHSPNGLKHTYDPEADAAYIYLKTQAPHTEKNTEHVTEDGVSVILDWVQGEITGVEILHVPESAVQTMSYLKTVLQGMDLNYAEHALQNIIKTKQQVS